MEETTKLCRKGDRLEFSYAGDLIFTAETRQEVLGMFDEWKAAMELCGLRFNLTKTKLFVTGKRGSSNERGSYPCVVCGRGVGSNSIRCNTMGEVVS